LDGRSRAIHCHWAGIDAYSMQTVSAGTDICNTIPSLAHAPSGWQHASAPDDNMLFFSRPPLNARASALLGRPVFGDVVLCRSVG